MRAEAHGYSSGGHSIHKEPKAGSPHPGVHEMKEMFSLSFLIGQIRPHVGLQRSTSSHYRVWGIRYHLDVFLEVPVAT